ncbi:SusD/RagB family nutrient-binding outer membrane lipoprotein [Coprobacter sp.]
MKNKIFSGMILAAAMSFVGCGDSLLDDLSLNTQVASADLSVAENYDQAVGMFLTAQQKMHDIGTAGGAHVYQYQFNLHIDNYAGYLASTQNFEGKLPSTYRYFPNYADGPQASFFNVAHAALPVMRSADKLDLKEIGAMCNIMYCFSALELSDVYGPFPWTDYKNDVQEPPVTYEPMNVIYDSLFYNLKASVQILDNFSSTSQEHQDRINEVLTKYDRICGSVDVWKKFANSIRMRMAVRMSNVDPARAEEEARLAFNDGLIDKSIVYNQNLYDNLSHPVVFISVLWNDTRLNASLENIMKRLNFPFMETIFLPNQNAIKNTAGEKVWEANEGIVGVRTGIPLTARDDNNPYINFSMVSSTYNTTPVALFKLSERYFLEAEAALRWGIGNMSTGYLRGIVAMFGEFNVPQSDKRFLEYWNQTDASIDTSIDYVDPSNPKNNMAGLLTVGVRINSSDDPKVKLEKIITQKWLANFPTGLEAWNDLRRTGYPRIFPTKDIGDGTLGKGRMIRRIPWNESDAATAQDIASTGLTALGGGNYERTTLWWDVEDPAGFCDNRWWERWAVGQ